MPAIEAKNLSKSFTSLKKDPGVKGSLKALFSREKTEVKAAKDINLRVEEGERVGFLGPNGAGKTTTLKMLTGILAPTSGEARVLGYVPFERKPELLRQIALVMGNKMQLWWDLPAYDGLVVLKELFDVSKPVFDQKLEELATALEITDKLHTQVRKLSLGERMKCELIASLFYSPRVIFLDEPTLGLDVVSQKRIRDFLRQQADREGSTLILTSHYMQDIEEVCDRVVIIDHGSIIFEGTLQTLKGQYSEGRRIRLSLSNAVETAELERYGKVIESDAESAVIQVAQAQVPAQTGAILQNLPVLDLHIEEIPIDDIIRDVFSSGSKSLPTS